MFTDFLPFFGTDYGLCSLIKPQVRETGRLGQKQTAFMGLDIGPLQGDPSGQLKPPVDLVQTLMAADWPLL